MPSASKQPSLKYSQLPLGFQNAMDSYTVLNIISIFVYPLLLAGGKCKFFLGFLLTSSSPCCPLAVSVLRFNCFSLCYLLMFFLSPFLPAAKRGHSTGKHRLSARLEPDLQTACFVAAVLRICLTIILALSAVFILTQSAYNIAIVSLGKNESSNNCESHSENVFLF